MALDNNRKKPLMPALASNRNVKSPITPRLAVQHSSASPSLSAKQNRSDVSTMRGIVARSPVARDDLTTPASIASNITPRSSARKSRIESNQSTPSGTPNSTPVTVRQNSAHDSNVCRPGGATSPFERAKSVVGETGPSRASPLIRSQTYSPGLKREPASSKFFHASDARPQETLPLPPPLKKAATFFYANGTQEEPQLGLCRSPSPPLSTVSVRTAKSQFYHTDGSRDNDRVPPLPPIRTTASHSNQASPTLKSGTSATGLPFRPPSPQKSSLHLTYRKGASQIISPINRSNALPILPPAHSGNSSPRPRSVSIEDEKSHQRTTSIASIDTSSSSPKSNGTNEAQAWSLSQASDGWKCMSQPPISHPATKAHAKDVPSTSANQPRPGSASVASPQSPLPTQNAGALVEAAANARRERKVLDLEISNSSLLAVNRQLERELRKQKTELRRFRRLSRAGRLTSAGSMLPPLDEDDSDEERPSLESEFKLSDDDLSDSEDDEDPGTSFSDESMDHSLTPAERAARDALCLAKDEKRLQHDLTKHRQLLVDSQKMNQSLKRCLTWSEEMIAEGHRALEYQVRVSDIRLGGRVLEREEDMTSNSEEHEDERGSQYPEPGRHGLLGRWTPPDDHSPLAVGGADDERVSGLGIGVDQRPDNWASSSFQRDSGVIVEDEIVQQLDRLSLSSPIKQRNLP